MTEPTGMHPAVREIIEGAPFKSTAMLRSSGIARLLLPSRCGGLALVDGEFVSAVHELAALDGSTGWLAATLNAAAHYVTGLPEPVAAEVWAATPDPLIAIGHLGSGALVAGRLTGRWTSVVATEQAQWLVLPVGNPVTCRVLVSATGLRIDPGGRRDGLDGAGVRDVTASDLAVADRYVLARDDDAAVLLGAAAAAAVVGSADGVWRSHVEQLRARFATSYGGGGLTNGTAAEVARAASDIDAARLQITASLGRPTTEPVAAQWAQRQAIFRAQSAADRLLGSGRHALDASDSVIQRWRDVHAGCRLGVRLLDGLDAAARRT